MVRQVPHATVAEFSRCGRPLRAAAQKPAAAADVCRGGRRTRPERRGRAVGRVARWCTDGGGAGWWGTCSRCRGLWRERAGSSPKFLHPRFPFCFALSVYCVAPRALHCSCSFVTTHRHPRWGLLPWGLLRPVCRPPPFCEALCALPVHWKGTLAGHPLPHRQSTGHSPGRVRFYPCRRRWRRRVFRVQGAVFQSLWSRRRLAAGPYTPHPCASTAGALTF